MNALCPETASFKDAGVRDVPSKVSLKAQEEVGASESLVGAAHTVLLRLARRIALKSLTAVKTASQNGFEYGLLSFQTASHPVVRRLQIHGGS
jgi:hypothetical protein